MGWVQILGWCGCDCHTSYQPEPSIPAFVLEPASSFSDADLTPLSQFTNMWNITGTRIHTSVRGSQPWAQGSLIPGANYSAQDDHGGMHVAGL